MEEQAPKPAPKSQGDLSASARAALRAADRCIRINQATEALRLIELAASQVRSLQSFPR